MQPVRLGMSALPERLMLPEMPSAIAGHGLWPARWRVYVARAAGRSKKCCLVGFGFRLAGGSIGDVGRAKVNSKTCINENCISE
jgi:hypothetical protein